VIGVPVLGGAGVVQAGQHAGGGTPPIGDEDGLPNGEDSHRQSAVCLKNLLDCGGPPQAGGSRGREQDDDACLIRRAIKIGFERGQIHRGQGRLAIGNLTRRQAIPDGERHYTSGDEEPPAARVHRSARKPATSCGATVIATTIAAQVQNMAREVRLRGRQTRGRL